MSRTGRCAGCKNPIVGRNYIRCSICTQPYDIQCANLTESKYKSLTAEHRSKWKCVLCINKQHKTDSTHTPVRGETSHHVSGDGVVEGVALGISPAASEVDGVEDNIPHIDLQALLLEVRQFREEMKATRHQMEMFNDTMAGLTVRINECDQKIDNLEGRVGKLEERLSDGGLPANDNFLLQTIEQLKCDLNDRDQDLLINDIEIACIPEEKGENLVHIVTTLGVKLGVKLAEEDLVSVTRVGKLHESLEQERAPRPRPIVVRLIRRSLKDQVLTATRVRRGVTTEDTGLPSPHRRFYINERLTKHNRQLFRQARDHGSRLGWRFIWTREGKIYARRQQDSPRHRIRAEGDLRRVFGLEVVGACPTKDN